MTASSTFTRGAAILRRHRILAISVASVAGLFVACLLFIWLALPYIVRTQAEAYIYDHSGHRLTMDRLAIVPLFEPRLQIDNLRLTQPDGSSLVEFRQLSIALSLSSLVHHTWVVDDIELDGLHTTLAVLPKQQLNWSPLLASLQGKGGSSSQPSQPPRILIRKFALADGQIDLVDHRTQTVQSVQIKPLAITLTNLSSLPSEKGEYALTATSSLGARIDWSGDVSLTPLSVAGTFRLDALSLTKLAALLPLPPNLAPPQGMATLSTRYQAGLIGNQFDFQLADLAMRVDGLHISGKQNPDASFALTHAALDGGQFDWRAQRIAIQSLSLTGGGVSARRLADGGIDLLTLIPASSPAPAQPMPPAKPAPPWHYRVADIALAGFSTEFRDQTVAPAADFALQDISGDIKNLSDNLNTPLPAHIAFRSRDGGSFTADGTIVAAAPSADIHLRLDGLALLPVQPYLGSLTLLKLAGGAISADGHAVYDKSGGRYTGGLAVRDLRIMAGERRRPFLAWKALATDTLTASPTSIDIRELRLDGLDTGLTIAADRTVSLAKILRQPKKAAARRAKTAAASPAAPVPVIDIGRLRVHHSQLDYADLSLLLPFATHIHDLDGEIAHISTRSGAGPARLQLNGQIDEDGSASASGRFDLLKPADLLDIDASFDNLEMTNFTPYLATFAGRRIASGTLTLHLQYKIDHGKLAGENQIILDQLTLGERVRSPQARDLPLDFALALLKDANGRIDLGLPISGSLDDPKFSYGQIIWKALTNVLTRIVTSPFHALGALFGGNGSAANITFAAGQSILAPPEQKALAKLAASLNSRPNLAVTIHGTWSEADRVALREQKLHEALAGKLDPHPVGDLGWMRPDATKIRPALEALYADNHGRGALLALKDGYRQANSGKLEESVSDRALSVFTGLIGKKPKLNANDVAKLKGVDFYATLYQKLRDAEDVPDTALQALAHTRGEAAVAALHAAQVRQDQVILKPEERVDAGSGGVPLGVGLGPLTQTGTIKAPPT